MGPTTKGGSWTSTIERVRSYALTYFGAMKIDDIGPSNFQRYWLWRKENYAKKAPSNATLDRERTSIRSLLNFAVKMGHISEIPEFTAPKNNGERRPTFTDQEWKAVVRAMDDWLAEGEQKATSRDRFLAAHCFLILVNTGIRIGEARKLQWGDLRSIEDGDDKYVVAEVRGKTGTREVVCQKGTCKLFNKIIDLRIAELKKQNPDDPDLWNPSRTELVFCHPDGKEIQTFKRSFHSLLKFANVPIIKNGTPRTIYSLRHLYATQRLYEDVSPFHLAKQMGTSVEMLEKHCGQTITASAAAQITKTRPKRSEAASPRHFED
ncbi:MAG: site-specific integrase [Parasphingorhabdus sp.]